MPPPPVPPPYICVGYAASVRVLALSAFFIHGHWSLSNYPYPSNNGSNLILVGFDVN